MGTPAFDVDRASGLPIHRQLRRHFTLLIDSEALKPGDYLPSTRRLAQDLGVHRLTALKAFQSMERAGLIRAHQGRGYYVVPRSRSGIDLDAPRDLLGTRAPYSVDYRTFYQDVVHSARNMPLSFAVGYPDPTLLPLRRVRALFSKWMDPASGSDFLYQFPRGHDLLREALAGYLAERGIALGEDRDILVTNGAQHALDLYVRAFERQTGVAALEAPAYAGMIAVLELNGVQALPVGQDMRGLRVTEVASLAKRERFDFLYTNPNFSNPSGMTLSRPRREALLALAREHGFQILEDDTYGDLGFTGARLPSLLALDGDAIVCRIGSFSKSFMPGLRMGYIVGPKPMIERMSLVHGINDMCSSTLSQLVLADALRSGLYERHVRRMRSIYHRRCTALAQALERELPPGCQFTVPRGGFFLWLRLPDGIDARDLRLSCNREGVDFADGAQFSSEGLAANFARLNFTHLDEAEIAAGVGVIAGTLRQALEARPRPRAGRTSSG